MEEVKTLGTGVTIKGSLKISTVKMTFRGFCRVTNVLSLVLIQLQDSGCNKPEQKLRSYCPGVLWRQE